MLGLLAIRSAYYQPERDVLSDAFEGEDFINGMRRINGAPYEPRAVIYNRAPQG
ncbi:hypothetical protein [Herbaspirillum sp. LeCh32-8]|uniref:hypothetical protein n=1 Tax=Herbaspirillum sp. LeCh32-8 TaxID=2821356 RepID=UPI001FD8542F|nr:hypothetical protein [Herbaspirillum sp. LeCh32-8]